jgi:hypothetical protein
MKIKRLVSLSFVGLIAAILILFLFRWLYLSLISVDEIDRQKIKTKFDTETLTYFSEIGFGAEGSKLDTRLSKWEENVITIGVFGNPRRADIKFLYSIVDTINSILKFKTISIDESQNSNQKIKIYFLSRDEIVSQYPHLEDVQFSVGGFIDYRKSYLHSLRPSKIIINGNMAREDRRKHVILEEVVQSLGLFCDSYTYTNSIFYQDYSADTVLTPIDKELIDLLYNYNLPTGLSRNKFQDQFLSEE